MKYAVLLITVLAAAPCQAAGLDMATQTCQDWLDADNDQQDQMIAWLHGYASGRSTSTLYDMSHGRADAGALKAYCQGHPSVGVITAASQGKR